VTQPPPPAWEATALFREFGLRIEQAASGFARIAVPRDRVRIRGARDSINGGVLSGLMEIAMRVCLDASLEDDERAGATREISVSYLSGARGDVTHLDARIVRKGRRLAVGTVEARDAATGMICAIAQVTCAVEPGRADRASVPD
jgi:uncharacterized protein (TIGR00369 family)